MGIKNKIGEKKVKKLEKIYYMVRLVFQERMAYAKAMWFDIVSTLVSIFIYYFLWQIAFHERNELAKFTVTEMTTYVILSKVLASQFAGGINSHFALWIYEGTIGTELTRPVSIFMILATRRGGEFLFYVLFKALPIFLISFGLLQGAGPYSFLSFLLFLLSILISVGIMFYVEVLVGIGSFYTLTYHALGFTKRALMDLLSGGVVPLFLFPEVLEKVLNFLPFAGMVSIPINIFLGKYGIQTSLFYIALQCFWMIILYQIAHGCYKKSIRKVVVQGG